MCSVSKVNDHFETTEQKSLVIMNAAQVFCKVIEKF